jgi:hypothetical protein
MQTGLPTPDITPAAKLPGNSVDCTQNQVDSPPPSPLQYKLTWRGVNNTPLYDCDATGNDYPGFSIGFPRSEQLSITLAAILHPICQGYVDADNNVPAYYDDISAASRLLQRDINTISKGGRGRPVKLQQNTIIRALTLFSLCRVYATQYLDHSLGDRIVWLDCLDTSAVWIKDAWERDVGHRMVKLIEYNYSAIAPICAPEAVYSVVHNTYFLMQFACYEYRELNDELCLVGAEPYSWHDLLFLRRRWGEMMAKKEAEEDDA